MRMLSALAVCLSVLGQDAATARAFYDQQLARRTVPLLQEVLRFPTVAGNAKAQADQKAWVMQLGLDLGFTVRDAGMVTEIELPGPAGSPVLGLVVHGDLQPVDDHWTIRPFSGAVKDGRVLGRGAADDKGPLVQALLAMKALKERGGKLTHTVRLLVGSDEESGSQDMTAYLKQYQAPDLSLVLDANFTVTVGEKAWVGFWVDSPLASRSAAEIRVETIDAGLAPSIVPDRAVAELSLSEDSAGLLTRLKQRPLAPGLRLELREATPTTEAKMGGSAGSPRRHFIVTVFGRTAHGGVNLEGGRPAGLRPAGQQGSLRRGARLAEPSRVWSHHG